jgi:hypothetical protein
LAGIQTNGYALQGEGFGLTGPEGAKQIGGLESGSRFNDDRRHLPFRVATVRAFAAEPSADNRQSV